MFDVFVCVSRLLESWIAFQMLRNLGCFAGRSIWDLIGMDANIGSWPGGYLCMYMVYIFFSLELLQFNLFVLFQQATVLENIRFIKSNSSDNILILLKV
jgi:hypothetical protein